MELEILEFGPRDALGVLRDAADVAFVTAASSLMFYAAARVVALILYQFLSV